MFFIISHNRTKVYTNQYKRRLEFNSKRFQRLREYRFYFLVEGFWVLQAEQQEQSPPQSHEVLPCFLRIIVATTTPMTTSEQNTIKIISPAPISFTLPYFLF